MEDRYENDSGNYSKAMSAFTRQRDIVINSSDAAIQKALHTFARENTKAVVPGKKKNSGRIPVSSKSKARRKYTMRGTGGSMRGRSTQKTCHKRLRKQTMLFTTLFQNKRTK